MIHTKLSSRCAILIFNAILLLSAISSIAQTNLAQYVNPFIGTGGHGHTFPGAVVPFGMVQLSPDTRIDGSWDGCSGYHYSDSIIYGFSHTHLSGTGISDYGDIMLMPVIGKGAFTTDDYRASFNHKNEHAEAGYYSVKLNNGVLTELTTTNRVGMHRYTFPKTEKAILAFDFSHRDECTEAYIKIESPTRVIGFRRSKAWAQDQYVAFVMEFSQPITDHVVSVDGVESKSVEISQQSAKINFSFKSDGVTPLLVKVSLSMVDIDGAAKNMKAELPHWNFDEIKKQATSTWDKELSKIQVTDSDKDKLTIFYTALYHCFTHPSTASDVDGRYLGMDKKIYQSTDYTHYTIFSLWDTFRALHPLYTIIDQKRTNDFIQSFLSMYQQGGRLPVWELAANETDCMIGYHNASVIADAAVKGIGSFDLNLAFEAMKKSSTWPHLGLPAYRTNGVITIDDEHESVSKTLEYAYDDFCIAQVARLLKKDTTYNQYIQRSLSYRNLFDARTGFMRPKKNGGWLTPFDPREVNNHFTEANSWQYSFFTPHDITGHISLLGGPRNFEKKLDELFTTNSLTTGREQADITGLIGQYAHGNEPSHHMAYLYNYVGRPHKTQQRVREILDNLYKNSPDGLSGNEDCGQMSAWYVLSSLGIYQVCPGTAEFSIGSPIFDNVIVNLENRNQLTITNKNNSTENKFIGSASHNGSLLKSPSISYEQLMKGGDLSLNMTNEPAITDSFFKESQIQKLTDSEFVTTPIITSNGKSFKGKTSVTIESCSDCSIYYTLNNTTPNETSKRYTGPIELKETTNLEAIAINTAGRKSYTTKATFYKFSNDWKIQITSKYNPQYTAGGDDGIIDGIRGDENWRKGEWQGYQSQDFEIVIDLIETKSVTEIGAGFLQDTRAWIIMPTQIEVELSLDGKNFTKAGNLKNNMLAEDFTVQIQNLKLSIQKQKTRFIKIKATNFGKLPSWHQGYPFNGEAFIFVDEVWVK